MTITGTAVATRGGDGLAPQAATALAIRPGQQMWDDKQRAALAVLGIKDATNADLAVFMHYCQKTGLDPFSRQIYGIMRRVKEGDQWVAKFTIQVGIDGFRVVRDRVAARLGITVEYEDTIWYDAAGNQHDVWLSPEPPAACRVTVLRDGRRFPGVVRTAAYAATNKQGDMVSQWKTQPDHMIEKCAEAFALRRAFPHDLGGIYVEEEIPAGEQPAAPVQARVTASEITSRPARRRQAPVQDVPEEPAGETGSPAPADAPPAEPADPEDYSQDIPDDARGPEALATGGQAGIIVRHFKRLGFTDEERDQRLAVTATIAGTDPVESTKQLTQPQAMAVQRTLERCKDRDQLIAILASGEAPHE
jgi:phage recombination protein Bet